MIKIRMNDEDITKKIKEIGLRETADYMRKEAGYTVSSVFIKLKNIGIPTKNLNAVGIHKMYIGTADTIRKQSVRATKRCVIDPGKIKALIAANWSDEKIAEEFFGNSKQDIYKAIRQVRAYCHKNG